MKLNDSLFQNRAEWEGVGIKVPNLDRAALIAATEKDPIWIHFGAGNIFRAFVAKAHQKLIENGLCDRGIVAAFTMEPDVIDALWKPCGNLSLCVTLNADGSTDREIIACVTECLYTETDFERLKQIFMSPSLQTVSFTITEKGYDPEGLAMRRVRALIACRDENLPLTLLSMDNCARNGEVLRNGLKLGERKNIATPWSMIDKITPRPVEKVLDSLRAIGFEDADTITTPAGTYASAVVNAESAEYLIIEDDFPNGRPPLEKAGVIFTDRETVNLCEKMKVGACLNPLHTCLAIFGSLLRYNTVAEMLGDKDIKKLIERLGYDENLPVVQDPKILSPREFLRECVARFANPFLGDTPARIATDSSQKIPVRYGETLKTYIEKCPENLETLEIIPFIFAGWCRYLTGVADDGKPFDPSADPLLAELSPHAKSGDLRPILSRADIFGADLYQTPIAAKVEKYFEKLSPGETRKMICEVANR